MKTTTRRGRCKKCFKTIIYVGRWTFRRVYSKKTLHSECTCNPLGYGWSWRMIDHDLRALWYKPTGHHTRRNDREKQLKRR